MDNLTELVNWHKPLVQAEFGLFEVLAVALLAGAGISMFCHLKYRAFHVWGVVVGAAISFFLWLVICVLSAKFGILVFFASAYAIVLLAYIDNAANVYPGELLDVLKARDSDLFELLSKDPTALKSVLTTLNSDVDLSDTDEFGAFRGIPRKAKRMFISAAVFGIAFFTFLAFYLTTHEQAHTGIAGTEEVTSTSLEKNATGVVHNQLNKNPLSLIEPLLVCARYYTDLSDRHLSKTDDLSIHYHARVMRGIADSLLAQSKFLAHFLDVPNKSYQALLRQIASSTEPTTDLQSVAGNDLSATCKSVYVGQEEYLHEGLDTLYSADEIRSLWAQSWDIPEIPAIDCRSENYETFFLSADNQGQIRGGPERRVAGWRLVLSENQVAVYNGSLHEQDLRPFANSLSDGNWTRTSDRTVVFQTSGYTLLFNPNFVDVTLIYHDTVGALMVSHLACSESSI